MNLLPAPRSLKLRPGRFIVPSRAALHLDATLKPDETRVIVRRLQSAAKGAGVKLLLSRVRGGAETQIRLVRKQGRPLRPSPASRKEAYTLTIGRRGVLIEFHEVGGLRAAIATLRQLLRQHGRRLPCLTIRDWPDFPRRGVMLDISRGRVPKLETLLELVDQLADFKINEFQLYIEHTFAYRRYRPVWRAWGALTGREIRKLDARCRELGIDLVPNQNSFGHLRQWLAHAPLKKLGEVKAPYESDGGDFLRHPSTLAPEHPGTLPFLRGLYDELLPNFSSDFFNVGGDETWDLGLGQSKTLCRRRGKGRVYLDFLKRIHREVARRGRHLMFWGDIILHYPELIGELPKDVVALNWGYEATHPFEREARLFSKSKVPFYVCPGTSTWMTLIGKHDNALANLRSAAQAGRKHGAAGYLITDWGDGGHPQPLAVSYLPYLAGAALAWCAKSFDEDFLVPVLSRDIFHDPSSRLAAAALALGLAHRRFGYTEPNATPFGTTIAAPPLENRELFCRRGLVHYLHIREKRIRAALAEVERQRQEIRRSLSVSRRGQRLAAELDLAARMAVQSCRFMLWQQVAAAGNHVLARSLAAVGLQELRELDKDFSAFWPLRNKGTTAKCSGFLQWRMKDYSVGAPA